MITEQEILDLGFYNARDPFLGPAYYSNQTIDSDYYDLSNLKSIKDEAYFMDFEQEEDFNMPKYLISTRQKDYYTLIIRKNIHNQDVIDFTTKKELVDLM